MCAVGDVDALPPENAVDGKIDSIEAQMTGLQAPPPGATAPLSTVEGPRPEAAPAAEVRLREFFQYGMKKMSCNSRFELALVAVQDC